jgi:hypothetical protein
MSNGLDGPWLLNSLMMAFRVQKDAEIDQHLTDYCK